MDNYVVGYVDGDYLVMKRKETKYGLEHYYSSVASACSLDSARKIADAMNASERVQESQSNREWV